MSYQKSQGQIEFEEQLASERECFQEDTLGQESATSQQDKTLPVIDLFLNPDRAAEKKAMLKKSRESLHHKKVKKCFPNFFLTGGLCESVPQHLPPVMEVNPALLPFPLLGDLLLHAHVEEVPVGGEGGQLLPDLQTGHHRHWRLLRL